VWTLASDALPAGLTLSQDGRIGGTPAGSASASFVVRLRDATGTERTQAMTLKVTTTPAPFVTRASFDADAGKLKLSGVYLDASASVAVNGSTVQGRVRFNATKAKLTISAPRLNVGSQGSNTVVVTIRGQRSNALVF
jgi:hypothetical protein